MIGLYFSGTGNTKFCVEKLIEAIDPNAQAISIENSHAIEGIKKNEIIILGYPIYYSSLPKIVKDFIFSNSNLFKGKKVFILVTMGMFSGDGAGCGARILKKCDATILGGVHIKMPDCIGDIKLFKKTFSKNQDMVFKAQKKINVVASNIVNNHYPKHGLGIASHLIGLFGQRLYFSKKTKQYYKNVTIDNQKCVSCGLCARNCPMHNIELVDGKINFLDRCTLCYRCFSNCSKQAITILGKTVYEQSTIEKYMKISGDKV